MTEFYKGAKIKKPTTPPSKSELTLSECLFALMTVRKSKHAKMSKMELLACVNEAWECFEIVEAHLNGAGQDPKKDA